MQELLNNPIVIKNLIIFFVIFEFILLTFLDYLNTKNWSNKLPKELEKIYDEKKYKESMDYQKANFKMATITSIINFVIILICIIFGIFGSIYDYLYNFSNNTIILTLLFFGIIYIFQTIISLPFSYYSNFVIEEKFSFNKMTKKTFWLDNLKSLFLNIIIGGLLLVLITLIYLKTGDYFWIGGLILISSFSILGMLFYSSLIVPLFNKQTPLEEGELKEAINDFAEKADFNLENIYVIDGSKRSNKANAYFTGLGSKKRIVLYDTLINEMTTKEIVAVLAHEIGHNKKKHNIQMLLISIFQNAIIFFMLGLILKSPIFSYAMGANNYSFSLSILAFAVLFTPLSIILGIFTNIISRKNEYEADKFATNHGYGEELKSALSKLSRNNLSNLRPHRIYEFFHYSHPTVLKRLKAIEGNIKK